MPAPAPTILIADDHPRMRRLLRGILEGGKYGIIEATNGLEAVEAHDEFHPAWIIMDVDMPEMDGVTATRTIQQRESNSRIVIITQHDSQAIRAEIDALGTYAFVPKDDLFDLPSLLKLHSDSNP